MSLLKLKNQLLEEDDLVKPKASGPPRPNQLRIPI